jgi:hypothetical protein
MNYSYIVEQYFDEVDSPRDWDNLGTMACWHRRYNLGDEQPRLEPAEWAAWLKKEHPRIIRSAELAAHAGIKRLAI